MNKNKKMFIGIGIIIVVLACIGILFLLKPSTPKVEQMEQDFIVENLETDEYSVTDFVVESETDGKDDLYEAIVGVTYNDGQVEYAEKYRIVYKKYDEWIFDSIEDYEEKNWSKKPLIAPTAEEFEKRCISALEENDEFTDYATFKIVDDKTEVNLDEGKTVFVFKVENKTDIENVSGEIAFEILFDYESGEWTVDNYTYADSFHTEYDLKHTWSGKAAHGGYHATSAPDEEDFSFSITEYNDETASGTLTYGDSKYSVSGEIVMPESPGSYISFDLCNVDKKIRIEGSIEIDGEMSVEVDTAYKPDAMFYYPKDRYYVDMNIEK